MLARFPGYAWHSILPREIRWTPTVLAISRRQRARASRSTDALPFAGAAPPGQRRAIIAGVRTGGKGGKPMRQPVRYYIEQSDDHAVVRSVPIPPVVQAPRPQSDAPTTLTPPETAPARRARVRRLVQAAIHRADGRR